MAKEPEDVFVSEFNSDDLYEILNCKNNPAYFISKYIKVINCDNGLTNIKLNKASIRMLARIHKNKKVLIKKTRQVGCDTINMAYLLWYSIFNRDKTSIILSSTINRSSHLLDRLKLMYENLPYFLKGNLVKNNAQEIKFNNGCYIKITSSIPEIRGYAISHIYIDELEFLQLSVLKNLVNIVFPIIYNTLNSKLIISITGRPVSNDACDIVYDIMDIHKFSVCKIPWYFIPERTTKWKLEMIIKIGWDAWNREFEV